MSEQNLALSGLLANLNLSTVEVFLQLFKFFEIRLLHGIQAVSSIEFMKTEGV